MSNKRAKSKKQKKNRKDLKLIQEAKNASIMARKTRTKIIETVSEGASEVKSRLKSILVMDRALK